jgi:hypothetical protein
MGTVAALILSVFVLLWGATLFFDRWGLGSTVANGYRAIRPRTIPSGCAGRRPTGQGPGYVRLSQSDHACYESMPVAGTGRTQVKSHRGRRSQ